MTKFETTDPAGRRVLLDARTKAHLRDRRPELLEAFDAIRATIANPDAHEDDSVPGRERFYKRDLTGTRWLRVVIDFNESPARVVTAFVQHHPPEAAR